MSEICIVYDQLQLGGTLVQIWLHRMLDGHKGATYNGIGIVLGTDYGRRLLIQIKDWQVHLLELSEAGVGRERKLVVPVASQVWPE